MKKTSVSLLAFAAFFVVLVLGWHQLLSVTQKRTDESADEDSYVVRQLDVAEGFASVVVYGVSVVEYIQGEEVSVSVYAPERVIDERLKLEVTDSTLTISLECGDMEPVPDVGITVTGSSIASVSAFDRRGQTDAKPRATDNRKTE